MSNKYITRDPFICHGKPTFKGTRIMVWQILEMLSLNSSSEEIKKAFPQITKRQIKASLEYASSLTREDQSSGGDQIKIPTLSA